MNDDKRTQEALTVEVQMDLTEACDAIQRRFGLDDDAMLAQLQAYVAREIDWIARRSVEASLHADGIIEDPDMDGGLFG